MAEVNKRKNRVSSTSSIESRDSESASPADKKTRNCFSEDEEAGEANMSDSEHIKQILERLNKLDTLETLSTKTLAKLENLEAHVNDLDVKLETLEAKSRNQDKSIGELKASANFFNQKDLLSADTVEVIKNQQLNINKLNKELLYIEAYSRRENLIITGIPESREDTGVEDTAKVLVDFMANELNVSNAADIDFQRVHRLGKPKDKGPRAIIARFLKYPDKERILLLGKHLRDKLFICSQITLKKFNDRGNDNLRSSKTQNKLEKGLPLAKASRICYTSIDS